MNTELLQSQIVNYFSGEQHEVTIILMIAPVVAALAFFLLLAAKDRFSVGFSIPVILLGIAFSITAASLLVRDKTLRANLISATETTEMARPALIAEKARIEKVIANYPYYRYGSIALVIIGFLAITLTRSSLANGITAGLLLAASAQLIIDHYSEARAEIYKTALEQFLGA